MFHNSCTVDPVDAGVRAETALHGGGGSRPSLDSEVAAAREAGRALSLDELVFLVVTAFRRHGHVGNVLTHISGSNWGKVEQALRSILDPRAGARDLTPLARNIIELMCADRGVTGRVMKPLFRDLMDAILEPGAAARFSRHVSVLFEEAQCKAHESRAATSA